MVGPGRWLDGAESRLHRRLQGTVHWLDFLSQPRRGFGAAQRGLDGFPAAVEGDEAVVDLTQFRLGSCRLEPIQPCSRPGSEVIVPDLPPPAWIAGCPEVPRDQLVGGACPSPTPHSPTP